MKKYCLAIFYFLSCFCSMALQAQSNSTQSLLIKNVWLLDGTGKPAYQSAVRIRGNQIIAIGALEVLTGETVIDGKGQYLSPGFIDSHSHHFSSLKNNPTGIAMTNQGITTIVIGQDGDSYPMDSLSNFFKQHQVAVNVASYTGHSAIREMVLGNNNLSRAATLQEIEQMKRLLAADLKKGALGLSTGLEYEAAFYSTKAEVIALAKVAASVKSRYISHIRSEDIQLNEAIDEIIEIGKATGMPVKLSHIKIANKLDWGKAAEVIEKLNQARQQGVDITADIYPYTFWNSTLRVLFPDKQFTNINSATLAVNQLFDANESVLVRYTPYPAYAGKTIAAIAKERNETSAATLINLIQMAADYKAAHPEVGSVEALAGKSMTELDIAAFMQWEHTNICSDGAAGGHPRGYGAFTRVLGKYVREQSILSLPEAIHKMTGLTAKHLGLKKRGLIAVGHYADLVLFDPTTVNDYATIDNGKALSKGIQMVWVNGQLVYHQQAATGQLSGTLIKRH